MVKIEKPGKGTKIREGTRSTVEAGLSLLPGGSLLVSFGRWAIPSKLDKQNQNWQERITQATNQQGEDIEGLTAQTELLRLEQSDLAERVDGTKAHVDALVRKVEVGIIETDPLDGELEICRGLVLSEKFQTALDLLTDRFDDPNRSNQISPKLRAQVLGLKGSCLKSLGKYDEAAQHFLSALQIDPDNLKIKANAVVGHLIQENSAAALELLQELLEEEPNASMHWANFIYVKSSVGEVIESDAIPATVRQSEDVLTAFVDAKRQNSDPRWVTSAQELARLYPESRRAMRLGAEADLDIAVRAIVTDTGNPADRTYAMKRAPKAASMLESQWNSHLEAESGRLAPDVTLLQNTLAALRITGNKEAASRLVTNHLDLLLSDNQAKQAVGAFALDTSDNDLLARVLATDFDGSAILRLESALREGDWRRAQEICETHPDEISRSGRIDSAFARDLLDAMLEGEACQPAAFQAIFHREGPPRAQNDLFLAQMASKAGLDELSAAAFDRAISSGAGADAELRRALAGEAMDRDMPDLVVDLLEEHVDPARDDLSRRWLAISYARSDIARQSGVAFFAALRTSSNSDAELNRAGGHFHLNRRQPREAASWFKRSLLSEPHNVRTQLAYWQSLSRDGATRRARDFLSNVDLVQLEGPVDDRIALAQLVWRNGRADALEYAYNLTSRNRNNFKACLGYSGLLLADAFDSATPPVPSIHEVSTDAMVTFARPGYEDWTIVITDVASDLTDHIEITNSVVQAALGKRCGDQFETSSGPTRFSWTIKEIKSKYLHLFHDITRTLQDQFPDNGSFYTLKIVGDDITPILESVRERRKAIERLEKIYLEGPMPIGAMARAGGGNSIDFAIHLAKCGKKIFSATGYAEDTSRELEAARRATDRILVLDAYTAWLLETLGVLDAIKDVFPKLTVPASALDEFGEIIENLGRSPDGRRSMAEHEDGFVLEEHSADEVARQAQLIQSISSKIASVCDVVGIEVPSKIDRELVRLANFMGPQFDCLAVVAREEGVLLSADLRLRQIASAIGKQEAFGIDAVLRVLAIEGALLTEAYADVLLHLCLHGHSYVALNSHVLLSMLRIDDTPNLERFAAAAEYLGTPDADLASHLKTAAEFIKRAFAYYHGGTIAQRAAGIVLRRMLHLQGIQLSETISILVTKIDDFRATQYFVDWLRGHFLMDVYERQIKENERG